MNRHILYISAAALITVFTGCEEGKLIEAPIVENITITPEKFTFAKEGGEQTVVISSTADWTIESEAYDWIKPSRTSGSDGDIISFTSNPNETGKELSAEFKFKSATGQETKFVAIIKSGEKESLELESSANVEITYSTDKIAIDLNTNLHYRSLEHSVSDEGADWLKHVVTTRTGENKAQLNFSLTENKGRENRTAAITIKADGVEPVTVNVIQRAKPVITPENRVYQIDIAGGELAVLVDANIEYSVTPSADWIKYTGKKDGKETFSIQASEDKRNSTVTFIESNPLSGVSPATASIEIQQISKADAIVTMAADMTSGRAHIIKWADATKTALTNAKQVTMEALVNGQDLQTYCSNGNYAFSLIMGTKSAYMSFGDGDDNGNKTVDYNLLNFNTGKSISNNAVQIMENRWYHVAVVFNNGKVTGYIDGKEIMSGNGSSSITLAVDYGAENFMRRNFWIGFCMYLNSDWKGYMAEARIWSKALSAEEINSENHFYEVDPNSEGLECYWKMNDGAGQIFKDSTGKGNDLQFEGNVRQSGYQIVSDKTDIKFIEVSLPQ